MDRKRKVILAKVATVMAAIPFLLWAHEYGPDPGYTGAPKDQAGATCANSQCHIATANDPNNKGGVSVTFPGGLSYSPGVKQHLVVTISDPAATQKAWGFQVTARLASNTATTAGTFAFTDANTLLMCSSANFAGFSAQCQKGFADSCTNTNSSCPANLPLQFMEHSLTGYNASKGHTGSQTYEFDWTPPATAQGNIQFFIAGNAANGDLT